MRCARIPLVHVDERFARHDEQGRAIAVYPVAYAAHPVRVGERCAEPALSRW